jgi:hypothetical protein
MGGMTHDPLCEWLTAQCTFETCGGAQMGDPCEHEWCQCELIAKVRADTLDKVHAWLSDSSPAPIDPGAPCADAFRTGYDLGRIRSCEAVNAMRGVRV